MDFLSVFGYVQWYGASTKQIGSSSFEKVGIEIRSTTLIE